jgi:hypothetical protein
MPTARMMADRGRLGKARSLDQVQQGDGAPNVQVPARARLRIGFSRQGEYAPL